MRIDGKNLVSECVTPDTYCVIAAGQSPWAVNYGAWETLHVYIPVMLLRSMVEQNGLPGDTDLVSTGMIRSKQMMSLGLRLVQEMSEADSLVRLQVDLMSQQFAVHALRARLDSTRQLGKLVAGRQGGLAPWQLKRACEAIDAQLDGEIGLEMLASIAGCSPTHFSRAFKQSTGLPPFAWLLQRRIERAQDLLADQRLSLAEIALSVGFSAQPQFTTAFKRVTGVTPGVWRRERLL